jgi:hypothetical protein
VTFKCWRRGNWSSCGIATASTVLSIGRSSGTPEGAGGTRAHALRAGFHEVLGVLRSVRPDVLGSTASNATRSPSIEIDLLVGRTAADQSAVRRRFSRR